MKARLAAVRTLQKVLALEQPCALDTAMQMIETSLSEQALRKALCQGVCRWYFTLQKWISILVDKPLKSKDQDLYCLLLIGLYQLYWMRTPDYACIQATTETAVALQKNWAKGFINAVLRKAQQQLQTKPPQFLQSDRQAWPDWLADTISQAWPSHSAQIFAAAQQSGPMTLRVNQQRLTRDEYAHQLRQAGLNFSYCTYAPQGIRLDQACPVENLPGFALGLCSVQDEAAQLAADLLDVQPNQRVLDACAAPGGKSHHIIASCPQLRELIALEKSAERMSLLYSNHQRLQLDGAPIHYQHADASQPQLWWDQQPFQRILLDAPCSASGIIRRHPDIKLLRRPEDISQLAATQYQLLQALWPCLAEGGKLLYATCSILPAENEQVITNFVSNTKNAQIQPIQADWGQPLENGRQLLPSIAGADGFYYALLAKMY